MSHSRRSRDTRALAGLGPEHILDTGMRVSILLLSAHLLTVGVVAPAGAGAGVTMAVGGGRATIPAHDAALRRVLVDVPEPRETRAPPPQVPPQNHPTIDEP